MDVSNSETNTKYLLIKLEFEGKVLNKAKQIFFLHFTKSFKEKKKKNYFLILFSEFLEREQIEWYFTNYYVLAVKYKWKRQELWRHWRQHDCHHFYLIFSCYRLNFKFISISPVLRQCSALAKGPCENSQNNSSKSVRLCFRSKFFKF